MSTVVSRFSGLFIAGSAALVIAFAAIGSNVIAAQAPDPNAPPAPELSPQISTKLNAFTALQNAQDWTGAMKLITDLESISTNGLYDKYFLNNIKWQIYLQDQRDPNSMAKALDPLMVALDLHEKYRFADQSEAERLYLTGSQLVYQSGADKPPAQRLDANKRSLALMKKYIGGASRVTADNIRFYAALLMQTYTDPDFPKGPERDAILDEALEYAQMGTRFWPNQSGASLVPNEEFYVIMLTAYLAKEKDEDAVTILEYLVHRNPKNDKYWDRLTQIYTTFAFQENEKPDRNKNKAFSYFMRALSAYDRAQAQGFLKTTTANEMIVGIYGAMEQYGAAADRLERDLKSGAIDNKEDKWENAALYYRLDKREDKALNLLRDASNRFPNSGRLDYLAAVAYQQLDDQKNAYDLAIRSANKGVGDKTWRSWALAAYAGFALNRPEDALKAVDNALKDPNALKDDPNLTNMKRALENEIKDAKERSENIKSMMSK